MNYLLGLMEQVAIGLEKFDPTTLTNEVKPAYDPSITINAVVRIVSEEIMLGDGKRLQIDLKIWTEPDEDDFPNIRDRVTFEGNTYIGERMTRVNDFDGDVDHYMTLLRRE